MYAEIPILLSPRLPSDSFVRPIIVILSFSVPCVLGLIYLAAFDITNLVWRAFKDDMDYSSSKEKIASCLWDGVRTTNIRVDDSAIHIQERDVRLEHIHKFSVPEARNTTLEPGELDVIMGLSGSCKISLLNPITRPCMKR